MQQYLTLINYSIILLIRDVYLTMVYILISSSQFPVHRSRSTGSTSVWFWRRKHNENGKMPIFLAISLYLQVSEYQDKYIFNYLFCVMYLCGIQRIILQSKYEKSIFLHFCWRTGSTYIWFYFWKKSNSPVWIDWPTCHIFVFCFFFVGH